MRGDSVHLTLKRILEQPPRTICSTCGGPFALYVVSGQYLGLCTPCTRDRIETCTLQPEDRPTWVGILYDEVLAEIEQVRYRQRGADTAEIVKCRECGAAIRRRDAKYRVAKTQAAEESCETRLIAARRLPDGTVLLFPDKGTPEICPPVCASCHQCSG